MSRLHSEKVVFERKSKIRTSGEPTKTNSALSIGIVGKKFVINETGHSRVRLRFMGRGCDETRQQGGVVWLALCSMGEHQVRTRSRWLG